MDNFIFYSPTKVYFGKETQKSTGEYLKAFGAKKILIHYGSDRVIQNGLMDEITASIKACGIEYTMLGGAVPNPRVSLVRVGAKLAKSENIDFILAVGGGSVIDSAKGIAIAAVNDCDIWDIYDGKEPAKTALPTGNVLTLAAAGSETSAHSVLTNEDGWLKKGYGSELLRPKFTVMNPELLLSLPNYQTAAGITDIIMHTLERYFSPGGYTELTDRLAEQILKIAIEYGKKCIEQPDNYDARAELMWAGSLSHNDLTGLGRASDWATHNLEHELSGKFDVTHGAGLAAMWGTWARFVYKVDVMRFVRYGVNVWGLAMDYINPENTALAAIRATEEYFTSIGMPVSITELLKGREVTDADIADMADKCTHGGTSQTGGFMRLGLNEVTEIYKNAK